VLADSFMGRIFFSGLAEVNGIMRAGDNLIAEERRGELCLGMAFKRQQTGPKSALEKTCQIAMQAWHRQDYTEYFRIMEQAARQYPANVRLLLDLGTSYGRRFDFAAAERCYEKAIRVAPKKGEVLVLAATMCRGLDRYEMTRRYLELATQEPGASGDTFIKLAEVYERFRLLDKAGEMVDRALRLDPANAMASLVRARLDRLSGKKEEAEKRLRPLLLLSGPDTWSTRIRGWYELGMVLDGQGRYDEAMQAFLEAKTMILPNAQQMLAAQKAMHARLKNVTEGLTAEMMGRWRAQEPATEPCRIALLCGHPRSGTTLLEQVLDSHPGFVSAEETMVFSRESFPILARGKPQGTLMLPTLEAASSEVLRDARQNYFKSMEHVLGHPADARILIDKNPSLTGLVPAFVRIFPETKLLVALRDPRDVCLSCFMQPLPMSQGSSMFLTLQTTAEEYVSIMGLWKVASECLGSGYMEVRYEDVVEDLEGVSRRALEYLGVTWDERVLRFNEFAQKKIVRSPTYAAVTKPITKGAVGRWRNYQKYLEPCLEMLAPLAKRFGYE